MVGEHPGLPHNITAEPELVQPQGHIAPQGVDFEKLHVLMKRMVNIKKSLRRSSGRVWKNPQVWKYGR